MTNQVEFSPRCGIGTLGSPAWSSADPSSIETYPLPPNAPRPAKMAPMKKYPLSFLVMEALGLLCLIPALASLLGLGARLHPMLADSGAGLALLVTAVSLIISGFFPFVLRRLMNGDQG